MPAWGNLYSSHGNRIAESGRDRRRIELNQVAEEALNLHGVGVSTDTLDVAEDDRMGQFVEIVTAGQPSFIIALLPCS